MTFMRLILLSGSLSSSPVRRCFRESLTKMSLGYSRGASQISSYRPMTESDLKGTVPVRSNCLVAQK